MSINTLSPHLGPPASKLTTPRSATKLTPPPPTATKLTPPSPTSPLTNLPSPPP